MSSFVLNEQQQAAVQGMIDRERDGRVTLEPGHVLHARIGINGCAAGSGKTRAMLALVHADVQTPHLPVGPHRARVRSYGMVVHEEIQCPTREHQTTVILASASLRAQWVTEIRDDLRYKVLDTVRKLATFVPEDFDVVIVNTTVYRRLSHMQCHWRRFIFDEADSFLFPGMPVLPASFTWLVTATWDTLARFVAPPRNRTPMARHALRQLLVDVPLRHLVVDPPAFVPPDLPAPIEHVHTCRRPTSITDAVAGHIGHEILTQIEAGDIPGAIRALGGDASSTSIVDLVRTRLTRSLAEARFRHDHHASNDIRRPMWQQRIEQLTREIQLVEDRFRSILEKDTCSICMDVFSTPVLTPCHHVFCMQCIVPWFTQSQSCPQCRTPMRHEQLTVMTTAVVVPANTDPLPVRVLTPTRMEHVARLVCRDRRPEQRILIFSEHDATLETIKRVIHPQPYGTLGGHSTTRAHVLRQFRNGQVPVLLLNSRLNGAGVDLPETTDVLLFHTMSASLELQAIGRGQRLGRVGALHVHRFQDGPG